MAGAGYKLFNVGDVLTAAQVNTYLQQQTVMVFASSAARTSALSAVLAEGMMSYLADTNSVEVYNGSAWVSVGSTGDITGVTAGTGISGGGTSGDVTVTNSMATAIDAKGDLIAGTGADAFSRLGVGANNTVLTADSAQATGLKWATPSTTGESYSLLSTTNLTGSGTITVTGITKDKLMIFIANGGGATANPTFQIRFNSNSSGVYSNIGGTNRAASSYATTNVAGTGGTFTLTEATIGQGSTATNTSMAAYVAVSGCTTAGFKRYFYASGSASNGGSSNEQVNGGGMFENTTAITSVSIINTAGNFTSGSIRVYEAS